jgi:hypothetical protein
VLRLGFPLDCAILIDRNRGCFLLDHPIFDPHDPSFMAVPADLAMLIGQLLNTPWGGANL